MRPDAALQSTDPGARDPSISDALVRVFEAGQRIVLDRVDLARFDLAQIATRTLRGAVLVAVGALLIAGAWFALITGAVLWLHIYLTLPASILIVVGASAALGMAAVAAGIHRATGDVGLPSGGAAEGER